jgi:hypothetical protein
MVMLEAECAVLLALGTCAEYYAASHVTSCCPDEAEFVHDQTQKFDLALHQL